MGEFLQREGHNLGIALVAVAIIAALHLSFRRGYLNWMSGGGALPFTGPVPSEDEQRGRSLFAGFTASLIFLIVFLGIAAATITVHNAAMLLGYRPAAEPWDLPNGDLLIWTLYGLYLWVEIGHLLRLASTWSRVRFVILLIALPLTATILARLVFDSIDPKIATIWQLAAFNRVANLLCLGLLPYLVPNIHAWLYAPAATRLTARAGDTWREAVVNLGNAVLLACAIGAYVLYLHVPDIHRYAQYDAWTGKSDASQPKGIVHNCLGYYPSESKRLGQQGAVLMSIIINTEGTVQQVQILKSSTYPLLDAASVECVRHWTYTPAVVKGKPIRVRRLVRVTWELSS